MFIITSFKVSRIRREIEWNVWQWGIPWDQISKIDNCALNCSDGFQDCVQEQKKEAQLNLYYECRHVKAAHKALDKEILSDQRETPNRRDKKCLVSLSYFIIYNASHFFHYNTIDSSESPSGAPMKDHIYRLAFRKSSVWSRDTYTVACGPYFLACYRKRQFSPFPETNLD